MCARSTVLFIAGPTGVGKSALAERIASQVPAEIINMDVGQFYTPLTIGTAKPDWRHSPIPHHLFDVVDTPINISVVEYREKVETLIKDIQARDKLPIFVGGSGFYLKSLFFPIAHAVAQQERTDVNGGDLWQLLASIDPARAAKIHQNDTYRLKRAIAIAEHTGSKPSSFAMPYKPLVNTYALLWVTRDREDLYRRINDRVTTMLAEGWLDEVRALKGTAWEDFLKEKKLIGYNELLQYLRDEDAQSLDDVAAVIAQRTRNYAKRQETFWRMLAKMLQKHLPDEHNGSSTPAMIAELNLTLLDLDLYIKQLLEHLQQ